MKQKDTKYLQLRGNVWWLYYRIPKRLKVLPQFEDLPAILARSLTTDSIIKARWRRDTIIHKLNEASQDPYDAWEEAFRRGKKEFHAKHTEVHPHEYHGLVLDILLDEARETSGLDERGDPIALQTSSKSN